MKKGIYIGLLAVLVAWTSCTVHKQSRDEAGNHYAHGFIITEEPSYTRVQVLNPWQEGELLATYYLVRYDSIVTPSDGLRLTVPVKRMALTSCTHVGFLKELGRADVICGITDPQLVYNRPPEADRPSEEGGWAHLGSAMTPDVERIVRSHPDAVMVSTYAQGDASTAKLRALGLPVVYNNEWTENDPLARAEWIRYVAAFLDCLPEADSIFADVEKEYGKLKVESGKWKEESVSIMSGNNFRGTWYMPSGGTYMGVLFRDAGAEYCFSGDTSHFSIPLSIETVLAQFSEADVWVGCPARTLDELASMDEKHTWFKAYQTGRVYNFLRRTTPEGANDFWETGVVHPEYVLIDLIHILYPALLPDTTWYFAEHLR